MTLIGANGAGKTTLLKTISGLIRPTAGNDRVRGQEHRSPPAAQDRRSRPEPGAGRARHSQAHDVMENLLHGCLYAQRCRDRQRHRLGVGAVSGAGGTARTDGGNAERRRATDAGDRPRAHGAAEVAVAGRAFARPRAKVHHADISDAFANSRTKARPSCSSNRMRAKHCRLPIMHTSWSAAGSISSGSGRELLNNPEVQRTYLGQHAA